MTMHARFVSLVIAGAWLWGAATPAAAQGQAGGTLDLDVRAEGQTLANAKEAFRQGEIVRLVGGRSEDLQRLLGVAASGLDLAKLNGNQAAAGQPAIEYQVVAARAAKGGALHEFLQIGAAAAGANNADSEAFTSWARNEELLAAQEASGASGAEPSPPAQAWTELQQLTVNDPNLNGNVYQNSIAVYRLNDINPNSDWYMVLTNPQSQPNYQGCKTFGTGNCGWWTHQRVFTMATTPAAILSDHGPLNTISSDSGYWTIGGSLGPEGPGINVSYSQNWEQPSVTTVDQSNLTTGMAQWTERFGGQAPFGGVPPQTSIGLFLSHQGAIFQFPEGTSGFQFSLSSIVTSYLQPLFGNPIPSYGGLPVQINVAPPVFAVSSPSLSIPPGGSANLEVTALNPSSSNSALGLAWDVSNAPEWLTVSQIKGSASARLILNVAPGTAVGTVASLNVDTNPSFAAPAVEKGPLTVRVTVGEPSGSSMGVLLSGGASGQKVLNTTNLYNPESDQLELGATTLDPRSDHTATLLDSGELLLAGGFSGPRAIGQTAELYDPETAKFSAAAGMMTDSRAFHTATLLENGSVLLVGGLDNANLSSGESLKSAELYDPVSQTFKSTGSMTTGRSGNTTTLLLNGTVLVAGGRPNVSLSGQTDTAEIYDPVSGQFTATAGKLSSGLYAHTATRLKDGHVLIAGGFADSGVTSVAELYNPATKTFSKTGELKAARAGHTATLLRDGRVLIAGGRDAKANPLASAEIYDPETQTFTLLSGNSACPGSSGCMTQARAFHTATRLPDGSVLLAFGLNTITATPLGSTDIFDPQTRTFAAGPGTVPRSGQTATLLERLATAATLDSSPNPSNSGESVTLTVTVKPSEGAAPTGAVNFLDGTTVLGTATLRASDKGIATFSVSSLGIGDHILSATYSGDSAHAKSTTAPHVQKVKAEATTTMLASSANPSKAGQPFTLTARIGGIPGANGPIGTVSFFDGTNVLGTAPVRGDRAALTIGTLAAGSHDITARYSGTAIYEASISSVLVQGVQAAKKATTVTTLVSSVNPSALNEAVTFTARVTGEGGTPTGSVRIEEGGNLLGTVVLSDGVAAFTTSRLPLGSHSIHAIYSGDGKFSGSQSAKLKQTVEGLSAAIVSLSAKPNPSKEDEEVVFTVTVRSQEGGSTPKGSITLSEGARIYGTAHLVDGAATVKFGALSPGLHLITAVYGGDSSHTGAQSPSLAQQVNSQ